MRFAALLLGLAVICVGLPAWAGGPLGPQGSRIETSNYGVDLFQGPVLASTRITSLAGSFTAISEGTDAIPFNPAAASLRLPYSTTRDDYDLTAGITLPASVEGTDFDNNGKVGFTYDDFYWVTAGGLIQSGPVGFGVVASFQSYELGSLGIPLSIPGSTTVVKGLVVRILRADPVASYGFLNEEIHVGAGLRLAGFYGVGLTGESVGPIREEQLLMSAFASGVQAGVLWAPKRWPFRVAGVVRSPVVQINEDIGRIEADENGDRVVGNVYLPDRVELPWEVEAGFAIQFWKRPFNLPWYDEDRFPKEESEPYRRTVGGEKEPSYRAARRLLKERYARIPRERVTVSCSALVSGPVKDSVGLESMLAQVVDRSGEKTVVGARVGVGAEVIPTWLVLRAGSYLEPTRFRGGEPRVHGTGGFDFRLFRSSLFGLHDEGTPFRVSAAVDGARDYFAWSVGAAIFR
jgi:hypothetical protein